MADLLKKALKRLDELIRSARSQDVVEPMAMSLATATTDGRPSVRTVYLHTIDAKGPVFFINSRSGKGRQLAQNPLASVCFFWPAMHYQAIVDGSVERLDAETSDALWRTRSRESQLGAWSSDHSSTLKSQPVPDERLAEAKQEFSFDRVPRPEGWYAYRLLPQRLEYWQTGWSKLRLREKYALNDAGEWEYEREAP